MVNRAAVHQIISGPTLEIKLRCQGVRGLVWFRRTETPDWILLFPFKEILLAQYEGQHLLEDF